MAKVQMLNVSGKKVSDIELNDNIFTIEPNRQVLYDVVNAQRAAMRQGTHDVKARGEVRGGGKKPWRQKGTGRARHGSRRSPIWVGGGVTFGPTPRSYNVKVNKKVRRLAIKSALSLQNERGNLIVVDNLVVEQPKTKLFNQILIDLEIKGKVLFVVDKLTENEIRAARNIPTVAFSEAKHLSVYDILNTKNLVLTESAVKILEEGLSNE